MTRRGVSKRMVLFWAVGAIAATCIGSAAWASPEDEVHARFQQWMVAFNSNDADKLASIYDQNARLLSTLGNEKPLDGRESIRAYFAAVFKQGRNSVALDHDDAIKMLGTSAAIETGYYHFDIPGADGKTQTLISGYTFAFEKKDGAWTIVRHHSSRVPALTATLTAR